MFVYLSVKDVVKGDEDIPLINLFFSIKSLIFWGFKTSDDDFRDVKGKCFKVWNQLNILYFLVFLWNKLIQFQVQYDQYKQF